LGHLDPELFDELAVLQQGLRTLFGTDNPFTLALTGTGMAGMESCFANLVEPGDEVVVGVHGFFGGRQVEMATRYGAKVTRVDAEWGQPLNVEAIANAVKQVGKPKIVACVHAETSTGVRQSLEPISEIARNAGALFVVDAVTSLGGLPVEVDKHGVDACYSATQKCVGCPPGLSPVTVSPRAWAAVEARTSKVSNWYLDWRLLAEYWGAAHAYHHTVPSNLLIGLCAGVREILDEGLDARFERHRRISALLLDSLEPLGIEPFAPEEHRLPTLNAVTIPEGVDDMAVRGRLLREYGIEIGGGLGVLKGRIWRIGTMGASASERNVALLAGALENILTA
jgi:alanine-glyoxylate transaminase/serine-glyoxylate transaminase/serine-pyruvate transaminase